MTHYSSEIRQVPKRNQWGRVIGTEAVKVTSRRRFAGGLSVVSEQPLTHLEAVAGLAYAIEAEQERITGTRAGAKDYTVARARAAQERTINAGGSEEDYVEELGAVLAERRAVPTGAGR